MLLQISIRGVQQFSTFTHATFRSCLAVFYKHFYPTTLIEIGVYPSSFLSHLFLLAETSSHSISIFSSLWFHPIRKRLSCMNPPKCTPAVQGYCALLINFSFCWAQKEKDIDSVLRECRAKLQEEEKMKDSAASAVSQRYVLIDFRGNILHVISYKQ